MELHMTDLSPFHITRKWPAQHPERLQLYSLPTPNGVKASIMLEEIGLPYEPHLVDFGSDDQFSPEFLSLAPNNKIPAILDPDGPNGHPLALFESGAILIYLAEKTGKLLPVDRKGRSRVIQWLMFQMGGIGPMQGQAGWFKRNAPDNQVAIDRYMTETKRLYGVLDAQLARTPFLAGADYSIADIANYGWVWASDFSGIDLGPFPQVKRWKDTIAARAAVQRGQAVPTDEQKAQNKAPFVRK